MAKRVWMGSYWAKLYAVFANTRILINVMIWCNHYTSLLHCFAHCHFSSKMVWKIDIWMWETDIWIQDQPRNFQDPRQHAIITSILSQDNPSIPSWPQSMCTCYGCEGMVGTYLNEWLCKRKEETGAYMEHEGAKSTSSSCGRFRKDQGPSNSLAWPAVKAAQSIWIGMGFWAWVSSIA